MLDIKIILKIISQLVDLSNTVIVVEKNVDIIKEANWIMDLGPKIGINGG